MKATARPNVLCDHSTCKCGQGIVPSAERHGSFLPPLFSTILERATSRGGAPGVTCP